MIRLGTVLLLGSALMTTRAGAQLTAPQESGIVRSGRTVQWSVASLSPRDSSLPRPLTFSLPEATPSPRHKSPFLAWFLSWLVPGGGQGYNGQWVKAAAFFVPAAVGFGLVVSNDGFNCSVDCGTRDAGLVLLVASSVGSQIEAPIAASKINRETRKTALSQVRLTVATVSF
jgi:hypothetical protein